MANKTIHELNQATTVTGSHEFAVYDTSNNSTQRASLAQIFDNNEILWADDEDEPIQTDPVDFDSADELNPTDTENVTLLTGTDSWSQRFQKISQMFKNIRFILGKLGTTDISSIGNGTVTGALSELNSNLDGLYSFTALRNKTFTQSIPQDTALLFVGKRGGTAVIAVLGANSGTAFCTMLSGSSGFITATVANGYFRFTTDAYTDGRVYNTYRQKQNQTYIQS